jgi:triosephosphate isomerase
MAKASQPCFIVGNWKMYKTIEQATEFIEKIIPLAANSSNTVMIAAPYTAIAPLAKKTEGTKVVIGAQNMNDASEGAFTGEVAAVMLQEAGAQFVILGHSERRLYFHESDEFINKKIKRALICNLRPILCIGETFEEHQQEQAKAKVKEQLEKCLAELDKSACQQLMVSYEPRWAIGTGLAATPKIVQEMTSYCRELLAEMFGEKEAKKVALLYGGSVNPDNAETFLQVPGVNGLLIGAASLDPDSFAKIIEIPQNVQKQVV